MMKELYGDIRGEIYKMRHTLIPWLHLLIPALGIAVFLMYYSFSAWSNWGKVSGYIQVLSVVLPLVISVICSMAAEMEENCHFQTFLGVSARRSHTLLAKWIVLTVMGFLSILLAVLGFAAGFGLMTGQMLLSAGEYLCLAAALWIGGADLYLFHLFLNLLFSKNVSLCVGTAELLIAALFLTGLGEGRWQFLPCSWGGRWSVYLLLYWRGTESVSLPYVARSLMTGIVVSAMLWALIFWWFCRYEGRMCKD